MLAEAVIISIVPVQCLRHSCIDLANQSALNYASCLSRSMTIRACVTLSLSDSPFSRPNIPAAAGDTGIAPPPVGPVVVGPLT